MRQTSRKPLFVTIPVAVMMAMLFVAGCGSTNQNDDVTEPQDTAADQGGIADTNQPQDVLDWDENPIDIPVGQDTNVPDEGGQDQGGQDQGGQDQGGQDTTVAGNPHDHWIGVDWDTFFPGPEKSAVYQVTTFNQVQKDLTAHVVYDVEWKGGTWTQIVVGDLEPGKDGMAIYFDKSEPWVIKAKGIVVYGEGVTDGPLMTEFFTEPLVIPLNKDIGEKQQTETEINGEYNGFVDAMGIDYEIQFMSFDADVTVPAGNYTGCADLKATLGGELIGWDQTIDVEIKVHPRQTIIRWVDSPGFALAELKSEWN